MKILKSLTQDHLHVSLNPTPDTTAIIVERPGLWMSPDELKALVGELRQVASSSLGPEDLDYGVLGGDYNRLNDAVITLVRDKDTGRPLAFNALSWMAIELHGERVDVLHLGLVMIDPSARSKGFSFVLYGFTCFVCFLRSGLRPIWISNVTQVPAVFGMVSETFSHVYPKLGSGAPVYEQVSIARQIMAHHRHVFGVGNDAWYQETGSVIANAYTGGSDNLKKRFDACQMHRKTEYNEFCRDRLDYERGDDILQLAKIDLPAAQRYVTRDIPGTSMLGISVSLAFLIVQSIALPIVHWFNPGRPYRNLRARNRS